MKHKVNKYVNVLTDFNCIYNYRYDSNIRAHIQVQTCQAGRAGSSRSPSTPQDTDTCRRRGNSHRCSYNHILTIHGDIVTFTVVLQSHLNNTRRYSNSHRCSYNHILTIHGDTVTVTVVLTITS